MVMPMVNNDMCSQIKGDAGQSRICAGGRSGEGVCDVRPTARTGRGVKTCFLGDFLTRRSHTNSVFSTLLQKDNGGPLVCQEHGHKVVIGVNIQRTKCASSQPALFVNVAFYSEWIYKVFRLYASPERN